jgi:hypothetical protein
MATFPAASCLHLHGDEAISGLTEHIDFGAVVSSPIVEFVVQAVVSQVGTGFVEYQGLEEGATFLIGGWIWQSL